MLNTNERIIKHKVGLLNLAEELGNVSKACQVMGLSRDTFYRYKNAVEDGGIDALLETDRRKPNPKNRVEPKIELAVTQHAIDFPAHGQVRVSNELRKQGLFVSPSGVRSIWLRHNLANFKSRLRALEAKVAEEGLILTEAQVQALERKKLDDEVCGEIETAHPGYLGSQDTFYVGTLKGVGRIYQQTYVDTYAKVAHCKLYTTKTPITAADMLNDRVLPFYEAHDLPVLRILTVEQSTAAAQKPMTTSCSWLSTISITPEPRQGHRRPTASVSASIRLSCRSSTRLPSARNSMKRRMSCSPIWTNGWNTTIMNEHIRARCAAGERLCKR